MSNSSLPTWYPLQHLDTEGVRFEPGPDEIRTYLKDRIDLFAEKGGREFKRGTFESNQELKKRAIEERKAFTLLKLGVSLDPRLSSWLLQVEGDLFQDRFMASKWEEKEKILNHLFPPDVYDRLWYNIEDLSHHLEEDLMKILKINENNTITRYANPSQVMRSYTVEDTVGNTNIIGINYRYATYLVKNRKALLYQGWVIGTIEKLSTTIKHRYERLLKHELEDTAERLETAAGGDVKKLSQTINEYLHEFVKLGREYDFKNLQLVGSFDENLSLYPPCIQDLMRMVDYKGYIPHWERFQLGLFLKQIGMHVDDQLNYWYQKASDNINISFDEFNKKAGYIIRHLYGLEGSKIDYDMPACKTIQSSGYCTFKDLGIDDINQKIREFMHSIDGPEQAQKHPIATEVSENAVQGLYNRACAKYLQLTTGRRLERVVHPLQFLQEAAESKGKLKKMEEEEQTDE